MISEFVVGLGGLIVMFLAALKARNTFYRWSARRREEDLEASRLREEAEERASQAAEAARKEKTKKAAEAAKKKGEILSSLEGEKDVLLWVVVRIDPNPMYGESFCGCRTHFCRTLEEVGEKFSPADRGFRGTNLFAVRKDGKVDCVADI